ncbi:hypothetical protein REPUB_Repub15cG0123100 [Reevesia pubescens]
MGSAAALKVLVDCAQAIQDGDLKVADSLLERIWNLAAAESDENQKEVVKYFGEALVRRAYGLHPTNTYALEITPRLCFCAHWWYDQTVSSLKDAINNGVMGKKRLHLIDFYVPHVYGWEYLFRELPDRNSGDPLSVRVSVILPQFLEKTVNVQLEKQYLNEIAREYLNVELEGEDYFKVVYANSLGEVDDESMLDFRRTEDEAVVVYYISKLQRLLADEGGAMERELLKLRQINPEVVILIEEDANHNDSNFITRLVESFQYYSLAFPFWKLADNKMKNNLRRQIGNIVGCEGKDRIVRHQNLVQWQSLLRYFGFLPIPIELNRELIDFYSSSIYKETGCLVVDMKENRPMICVSAWKLTQSEDHFNQISYYNFVQDLYKKRILFIERTSCYANNWESRDFMKRCAETHLLEGQAIAGKALQSSEDFHFEPSITKLKKRDHPLAGAAREFEKRSGNHAIVAICLQNHYTIDDVYVVELFLDTAFKRKNEAKKLASVLFNDLKNMKKKFVTLRVQGTEVGFQEEALSNIPQGTITMTNPPPPSSSANFLNSETIRYMNTIEPKDDYATETQGLNEQGGVIPNFQQYPEPIYAPLPTGTNPFNAPNSTSYNGVLETIVCEQDASNGANRDFLLTNGLGMGEDSHVPVHLQGNGKHTSFEPNVNNLPISSAKRRKLTSNVWEEFTKEDGWAICAHCSRKFDGSSKKGTTHLRNHLERCKRRTTTTVRDQQLLFPARRDDSKNESVGEGNPPFDQDRSSMDFARMIIMHQCPLNMVEYKFFNNFLKNLQPMFKLQSQEALSSDIFRVYTEEKGRLLEYFDNLSCRFNLTMNVWADDLGKIRYCCYNVQFVDDNWELKKKILALKSFGHEFNTRIFYENFKSLLVDWNLDKKVCSLTIHNSSSSLEIAEEIRKSWPSFEASHPLSTFYISSDDCIHGLLCKDISSENVGKSIDGAIKTSSACLLDIHDIYKKLSQRERGGYPLMNVKSDGNDWRSTCSLVLAIAAILDPRFKFHLVEFSYNTIYGFDAAKIHLTVIRTALTGIFNEYASNMNDGTSLFVGTNSLTLLNAEKNSMESFLSWYNSKRNVKIEASWKSELDKYLDQELVISSDMEFDVLVWWSEHASSFPILGRMACDILAIPMSSILSGSTFNEKVTMDNPIFSGLDFQIIEAMICCRDWLEEAPKEISNMEPNSRLGNKGCPIVKLEDNPALAHHPELKRFSSESGREVTTWTKKDVRAYLVSHFTDEEKKHLSEWKNHTFSGEYVGRDKILDKVLKPLLLIPPPDVSLGDAQKYYIDEYYIDDRVVDQFFILLKRRYESFPHKYLKHYSFNSLNAALFINGSKTESEMLSWVKEEDLKGVRKLFMPICLHQHWLLFYVDIDDKKLLWLDSIEHSQMSNDLEKQQKIRRWFLEFLLPSLGHDYNAKDWLFDVPKDIPLQKNSVDCALFVMKYADCLTHANYFPFTKDDMPHFRHRTFLDLCRGSLRLE